MRARLSCCDAFSFFLLSSYSPFITRGWGAQQCDRLVPAVLVLAAVVLVRCSLIREALSAPQTEATPRARADRTRTGATACAYQLSCVWICGSVRDPRVDAGLSAPGGGGSFSSVLCPPHSFITCRSWGAALPWLTKSSSRGTTVKGQPAGSRPSSPLSWRAGWADTASWPAPTFKWQTLT